MAQPARRGKGALGEVVGTVVSVLTLPFRALGRLFGRRGGGPRR